MKGIVTLIIILISIYYQFFILGKIPIPADLMTGVYYPWLDYKWGFNTGVPVINPSISDIYSQFYPWKYLIIDIYKNGVVPLWNQYSFSGVPLLANYHSGVLFPPNVILFLPKNIGWGIFIFCQTLCAAIGMYYLLRHYTKSTITRIIGSLVFSLSGLMTTWVEFGTGVWAASMIPWCILFVKNYIHSKKNSNLALLSIAYSLLILAGHAQLTLYAGLLLTSYIFFSYFTKNITFKESIKIFLYIAIGIGISSPQLIPAIEQAKLSIRSVEASYIKELNYGLTPWYDLIRLFCSDFFGHPSTYNYWGDISFYENSAFMSTIGFALILPIFIYKRVSHKDTLFYIVAFIVSIFFASDNPITQYIYKQNLPFLTYSLASRILFITSFSSAVLVSLSIDKLSKYKYKKIISISTIILAIILISGIIILNYLKIDATNIKISFRNSILPIFQLVIFVIILNSKIKRKLLLIFILLLISFDLFRYFNKFNPFVYEKLIFPDTPTITYLKQQTGLFRIGRLDRQIMTPNTWIPYKLSSLEGYDPLALNNYSHYFNRVNNNLYNDKVTRFSEIFNNNFDYLSALNVKYLLSVEKEKNEDKKYFIQNNLTEVFRDKSSVIYKNNNANERIYFAKNVIKINNKTEIDDKFNDNSFSPKQDAIIVSDNYNEYDLKSGDIDEIEYSDNNILFQVTNNSRGFVVIDDTYTPDWTAKIDGNATKLYEVNGALRGIFIEEGKHTIEINYWPKSFQTGIYISISSIILLLTSTIYFIYKNK